MKFGIRSKLFLIALGLVALSVLVAYLSASARIEADAKKRIRDDLSVRARLVAVGASAPQPEIDAAGGWDALADRLGEEAGGRVTLVALDGHVLGDSMVPPDELGGLDDHRKRPEVRAALEGTAGRSQRLSTTTQKEMIYAAVPFLREGKIFGVARVALDLTQLDSLLRALREGLFLSAGLALLVTLPVTSLGVLLVSRTARSLTDTARLMAGGDLHVRTRAEGADEFAELGRALDRMAKNMSTTLGELREERDRLTGILESMDEGVLFLDEKGRVALLNSTLREMLMLPGDTLGRPLSASLLEDDLEEVLSLAKENESVQREIEVKGLKPRKIMVRVARLEGAQSGILAVFVDVTETRRLESMRREFVANVSHELRTPVTTIRSAGESLKLAITTQPKMAEKFADIIERNSERLQNLVEDLLNLSQIESREYSLSLEALDPQLFSDQIMTLFSERAARLDIELKVEAQDASKVNADKRALDHVLTNLIDNAVKYAGRGKVVTVSASDQGAMVIFRVKDTGPGIPKKHQPRLFERFYRIDAGRSREVGGTGLGLSIVKHLVDSMGGRVSVESEEGQGTTFVVSLPRFKEAASQQAEGPEAQKAEQIQS